MDNFKYAKIEKVIHQSYKINKEFSIFNEQTESKQEEIRQLFTQLTKPFTTDFELIKAIEIFAELTRYSFKRINIYKERKKDIIFACSSISPKKSDDSVSSEQSGRSRKRINSDSCPMRLKFKWDDGQEHFLLTEKSDFNHNHDALSPSSEEYSKMSQNIRFPVRWIHQIFRGIMEIPHSAKNESQNLDKKLSEIKNDLILQNKINFKSSSYRTNYCKKLIYLIKKINRETQKAAAMQTLEEKFFAVMKFVLKRGANYFSHESLHFVNSVFKSCDSNPFAFYEEFAKLIDSL